MRMMEERFMSWLAWKLPMFLVRHCVIRAAALASKQHGDKAMGELNAWDLLGN